MRNGSAAIVWVVLVFVVSTGSCGLCAVFYLPYAERMVGCTDCAVLEVGDPDATAWSNLEAGTEYVLVGCTAPQKHQVAGLEWIIIGNDKKHEIRRLHEVAIRLETSEWRGGHHEWYPFAGQCNRMLVRYEGTLNHALEWDTFVVLDVTSYFKDRTMAYD